MYEGQNGLCAICNKPETMVSLKTKKEYMLQVDHCHDTGKIRGLLCSNCNNGLGRFKDNIESLKAAIDYLSKYKN